MATLIALFGALRPLEPHPRDRTVRNLTELQQKLTHKSQQLQGEAQEAVLRETLERAFPRDTFEDVGTGQRGGDVVQTVTDEAGRVCGTILWESKRTQSWSEAWIAKALEDQRARQASCVILVSQALPAGVSGVDERRNVWVAAWSHFVPLAKALRSRIIDLATERRNADGRDDKAHRMFRYVSGDLFEARVKGLVSVFGDLRDGLNRERRGMQNAWSRREEQIETGERQLEDIRGRVGSILGGAPDALLDLEESGPTSANDTGERHSAPRVSGAEEQVQIVLAQLPADGTLVSVDRVKTGFLEACAARRLADVDESTFDRVVDSMAERGLFRRARRAIGRAGVAAVG